MKENFMQYERPSVTADVVMLKIHDTLINKRQKSKKKTLKKQKKTEKYKK